MCGAFSILHPFRDVSGRFNAGYNGTPLPPRYNARPSQFLPVILNRDPNEIVLAKWGLTPKWPGARMLINARADSLATKAMYHEALRNRRCLILADGFYEWGKKDGKKIPYRFQLRTKTLFAFAGIWQEEKQQNGEPIPTFVIITTEPNEVVLKVHDRMPATLLPHHEKDWLEPQLPTSAALHMLNPLPANLMKCYPVSTLVNSPANDTRDVIKPARV